MVTIITSVTKGMYEVGTSILYCGITSPTRRLLACIPTNGSEGPSKNDEFVLGPMSKQWHVRNKIEGYHSSSHVISEANRAIRRRCHDGNP